MNVPEDDIDQRLSKALAEMLDGRDTLRARIAVQYDKIVEARKRGFSLKEIAAEISAAGIPISDATLSSYLRRIEASLQLRDSGKKGRKGNKKDDEVAIDMDLSPKGHGLQSSVGQQQQRPIPESGGQSGEIRPAKRLLINKLNQPPSGTEPPKSTTDTPVAENDAKKVSWFDLLSVAPSSPLPEVQLPLRLSEDGMPDVPPHEQFEVKSLDGTKMVPIYRIVTSNKKLGMKGQFFFRLLPGVDHDLPFGTNFNGVRFINAYLGEEQPLSAKIIGVNT